MIMPNFMQVFNAYTSQIQMKMIYKGITGDIQKVKRTLGYNNAMEVFAQCLWRLAPTGDFTLDNFYYGSMIFVGSGTTAPTSDDYKLESPCVYSDSGLHVVNIAQAYKEEYKTNRVVTITVRNNSLEDITVSEMGWFIAASVDNSIDQTGEYYRMMLAREVFEPVTIKPGEVRAFTMSIEM